VLLLGERVEVGHKEGRTDSEWRDEGQKKIKWSRM
jgi:hypothetical protein